MELTVLVAGTILGCVFVKWLVNFVLKCKSLPPGPWGVPVFGYVPWMTKKSHEDFCRIAKKYGNVFSVTLGSETTVVLNDWSSIKQSLVDQPQIFKGRPNFHMFEALGKNKNVAFIDSGHWKKQRALVIRCMRDVGMGKKSMESRVMDLVHEVIEELQKHDGQTFQMHSLFFGPILRLIWNLIANSEIKDAELKRFEKFLFELFKAIGSNYPINLFPWLRFVPPNGFGYWKFLKVNEKFLSFLKHEIDQHQVNLNEGALHDFVDFYLAEIKANENSTKASEVHYKAEYLLMSVWELFLAGLETVNTTSLWGFLYLAYHPEVQEKARAEIDRVVGRHRLPTLDDFPQLPYTEAVILETHRFASVVPLSLPHKTHDSARVSGYTIPKDTTCFQNIYAVHHDPTLWDRPDIFNPERFLDENNTLKIPPYLMPFSVGPRMCLGKSLADMQLRLIFSCLLHQFSFSLPTDRPKPTLEPEVLLVIQPHPYSLLIQTRNN